MQMGEFGQAWLTAGNDYKGQSASLACCFTDVLNGLNFFVHSISKEVISNAKALRSTGTVDNTCHIIGRLCRNGHQ
jgi:hypothetical protein